MAVTVRVQAEDFDVGAELDAMRAGKPEVGALASFVGVVRDRERREDDDAVSSLVLEHYPGMTERSIEAICDEAVRRWSLVDVCVIHRVGALAPTDRIVFVGTSAPHRGAALDACAFVIDYLKTEAPFWKKEITSTGARWVDARTSDDDALARWAS